MQNNKEHEDQWGTSVVPTKDTLTLKSMKIFWVPKSPLGDCQQCTCRMNTMQLLYPLTLGLHVNLEKQLQSLMGLTIELYLRKIKLT